MPVVTSQVHLVGVWREGQLAEARGEGRAGRSSGDTATRGRNQGRESGLMSMLTRLPYACFP